MLARIHIPNRAGVPRQLVLAQDDGSPRVRLVGAVQAFFQIARIPELHGKALAPEPLGQHQRLIHRGLANREDGDGPGRFAHAPGQQGQPFHPGGPADAGCFRTTHLSDQAVVSSAGQDGTLGAQVVGGEFKRSVAIIVEAPNQPVIMGKVDADARQPVT